MHMSRLSQRMTVYCDIQTENNRKPMLIPNPANETQWNGLIDKTVRANIIMGDICAALTTLLSPGGSDCDSLTAAKIVSMISPEFHTEIMIRQFYDSLRVLPCLPRSSQSLCRTIGRCGCMFFMKVGLQLHYHAISHLLLWQVCIVCLMYFVRLYLQSVLTSPTS